MRKIPTHHNPLVKNLQLKKDTVTYVTSICHSNFFRLFQGILSKTLIIEKKSGEDGANSETDSFLTLNMFSQVVETINQIGFPEDINAKSDYHMLKFY